MATKIQAWQIKKDQTMELINTTLTENGRTEPGNLETWLSNNPSIISPDIRLIGRQVLTRVGEIDLLGIDISGNLIVIEWPIQV
jgi:RecB family endonuclease NucS